jgi:G6PDH family F420-dependent oxidoreductase
MTDGKRTIGIMLSAEEHSPRDLVRYGTLAADHGFTDIVVSDHFHPWNGAQGESPFVWGVLGALASAIPGVRLGTAVTCPTMRIHPAIVAQAAATASLLCDGRFFLGVGSGEQLNEHVLGQRWAPADIRLEMLEEAVQVMRDLWTGDEVTHHGTHYTVENARLYSAPSGDISVPVSGFGPKAQALAARIGDGLFVTGPDEEAVKAFRDAGGRGPIIGCPKVCWNEDEQQARKLVHELWPNSGLPGELAQELRTPAIFEQAAEIVDEETAVGSTPVGPDPEVHAASLRTYFDIGFDEVYVAQIGPDQEQFLRFMRDEVLPRV